MSVGQVAALQRDAQGPAGADHPGFAGNPQVHHRGHQRQRDAVFDLGRYREVTESYLAGLEDHRLAAGKTQRCQMNL